MKWITRSNITVDRVACPWLIRRFVDPEAEVTRSAWRGSFRSATHYTNSFATSRTER